MKKVLGLSVSALLLAVPAFGQDVMVAAPGSAPHIVNNGSWIGTDADLWDQGPHDGQNGLSNATSAPFGFRRTILFDFVVPSGQSWNVTGMRWNSVWNSLPPGSGTGAELRYYSDAGGSPGSPITSVVTSSSYSEAATGNVYFSRPESAHTAGFASQNFGPGTYWTDMTVVGPENNFWLTAAIKNGTECWVDYADFGGLQPGINVFGVSYDVMGVVTGTTGGGGYTCTITGTCPGTIRLAWSGAPANRQQGIVFARNTGNYQIPNGPCAGTRLGLGTNQLQLYNTISTGNGAGSVNASVSSGACRGYVQLVAVTTPCQTSNVAQVP